MAALSRAFASIVLLAPYFGRFSSEARNDVNHFLAAIGAFDFANFSIPGVGDVPLRSSMPSLITTTLAARDEITEPVRTSIQVLCIAAEDDNAIDVPIARDICTGELGRSAFVYPASLKVDHLITPETGSKYSDAMLENIASFFVNGTVDSSSFLKPNGLIDQDSE